MFERNASPAFKKHALGIILLGCIAMYFSCCLTTDAMNVIQPAFTAQFGWSYTNISLPFTIGSYVLVIGSFLLGTMLIKNGTRLFALLAYGGTALFALLLGIAYSMDAAIAWPVYFVSGLMLRIGCVMMQMVTFQLCANWFSSTRGRILGIVTMAAPLNSASSTTLMTLGMNVFGLTAVYSVIAVIMLIATGLAAVFAVTNPADRNMTPDGIEAVARENIPAHPVKKVMPFREIIRKPQLWLLSLTFGILNGTIAAVMAFFITRMTEVDVPTTTALFILSAASVAGIPLSYVFGWLDDKLGTIVACRILAVCYIVMLGCFYFGNSASLFLIIIAALGMAAMTGGCPNLHPSSLMYVFGADEYQNANRWSGIPINLISGTGAMVMSMVMDATGSLDAGYLLFAGLSAVALICLMFVRKLPEAN